MFPDGNKGDEPLTSDKDLQPDTVPRDEASLGGGGAAENAEANIGSANLPAIGSSSRDCVEPAVTTPDPVATSAGGAIPKMDVPKAPARRPIFDPYEIISVPGAPASGPIFPEEFLLPGGTVDLEYVSPWLRELVRPSFGLSSLDAFTGFQAGGFTPKTGEYSFQLAAQEFRRLLALARCTFDAHLKLRGLIKMSVSQLSLRAQAYDYATFPRRFCH